MKLDDVRKLQQKKFRDLLGHFVVEGEHLILELQKAARQDPALRRAVRKAGGTSFKPCCTWPRRAGR